MAEHAIREPILVTGGSGFIGRRLVQKLLEQGHKPVVLLRPNRPRPASWGEQVAVRYGDVARASSVSEAMKGIRTVYHLAAVVNDRSPWPEHHRVTIRGTEHVLGEAAKLGARAILTSSAAVYGRDLQHHVCDEQRGHGKPVGAYSRSKQAQERIALRLEGEQGLRVTIVRPANTYGAGSPNWVNAVCTELHSGLPTLPGGGHGNAALVHVDNLADLLVRAAVPLAVGRIFNGCDDQKITWRRYFTDLALLCGARPPRSMPLFLARGLAIALENAFELAGAKRRPPVTREALNLVSADMRVPGGKARRELGHVPSIDYDQGMKEVAAYLEKRA